MSLWSVAHSLWEEGNVRLFFSVYLLFPFFFLLHLHPPKGHDVVVQTNFMMQKKEQSQTTAVRKRRVVLMRTTASLLH